MSDTDYSDYEFTPAQQQPTDNTAPPLAVDPGLTSPRATSVAGPIPDPQESEFVPANPDDSTPAFVPPIVAHSLYKDGVMNTLNNESPDQGFDDAVRLNMGDLKWPLMAFKGINPDVAAKVDELAKNNGLPFSTANAGKDDLDVLQQARDIYASLSSTDSAGNFNYPNTIKWLNDPINLAKAKDDVDALKGIEDSVRANDQAGESAWFQTARGAASGIEKSLSPLLKLPSIAVQMAKSGIEQEGDDQGPIGQTLNDLSGNNLHDIKFQENPDWLETMFGLTRTIDQHADANDGATLANRSIAGDFQKGNYVGAAQMTAVALASFVPTVGAALVNPELGLAEGAGSSSATQYQTDLDAGKTPTQAAQDAVLNAGVNVAGTATLGTVGQMQRMQQLFAAPVARETATALWGRVARQAAYSAVQGGVGQAGMQAGDDAADYVTGNKDAFGNESQKLTTAALLGFLADGTMAAPAGAFEGLRQLAQQEQGASAWARLTGSAQQSKLLQRDPDALAQVINNNLVAAGKPTTVGVDADKLTTFFQNRPADDLTNFAKDMGLKSEDITNAAATGSAVDLPIGQYQAKYVGTDLDKAIAQDLRFTPGGLSENELKDQMAHVQALSEGIKAELAKTVNGESTELPQQIVTMRDQLMADKAKGGMGYTADQADSQLAVLLAGIKHSVARPGETTADVVNRLGLALQIGGEAPLTDHNSLVKNQEGINVNANGEAANDQPVGEHGSTIGGGNGGNADSAHTPQPVEAGAGTRQSLVGDAQRQAAQEHLEKILAGMTPGERAILEDGLRQAHSELAGLSPQALNDLIAVQRAPYPVKGNKVAKAVDGPIHLVTSFDKAYWNEDVDRNRKEFFKNHLDADEVDTDALEGLDPTHKIVDATGESNSHFDFTGVDKELVTQPVQRISNKLDEAHAAPSAYPETASLRSAGVRGIQLETSDLDRFDKIFGKDNWLIKPYHPDIAMSGTGVFFAEAVRKAFNGEPALYNKGDNPTGESDVPLTKEIIQRIARPAYYLVQGKHDVAGATPEMRVQGLTILNGEKRVHVLTDQNGGVHTVLGSTFRRSIEPGDRKLYVHHYDTPETISAEDAAKKGIEQYPVEERSGSSFGPDMVPLKDGGHGLVESNPAVIGGQVDRRTGVDMPPSPPGTFDYPHYQDAFVSALRGELPTHVLLTREIMAKLAGLPDGTDLNHIAYFATKVRNQDARGAITFGDGKTVIHLLKTADFSTFAHEAGHLFLHGRQDLIEKGLATPQAIADHESLLKFAGVKPGEKLDRESEEKIVTAFESYLREGKAPSIELAGPFSRFRTWLTNIYRSVTSLGVQPTDEIKQVFDRMLASEDDINHAQEYYSRKGDILNLIKADEKDKDVVRNKLAKVKTSELDKSVRAYLKSYLQAIGGVSEVRSKAKEAVEAQPIYKALETAKSGKIDEDSLRDALGSNGLKEFTEKFPDLVKKGGEHTLESLAAQHNFQSPETLGDNLLAAVPKSEAVKNYTSRLVAE